MTRRLDGRARLAGLLLGGALAALPAAAEQAAPQSVDAAAAFARLKGLAGDWQGNATTPDGPAMAVEYRLTGGGSALVERLFAGSPHEMLSVYYMEGGELVLTHYCAMANQPKMKLVAGGKDGELVFDFVSGSNLDPASSTHIHGGRIRLEAPDRVEASWQVWSKGRPSGANRMFLQRSPAKAARE